MKLINRKAVSLLILAGIMTAFVTGCGQKGSQSDYVEGLLDVAYHSDSLNQKAIDMTDEEISKAHDAADKSEASFLEAYFNMEGISKDTQKAFEELAEKMAMKADYEVKKSSKEEVVVKIKPLKVTSDELTLFVDDYNVRKFVNADESCTEEAFVNEVVKIIEKNIENAEYGETVTIKVNVAKDNGKYNITDKDLSKIDSAMFEYQ